MRPRQASLREYPLWVYKQAYWGRIYDPRWDLWLDHCLLAKPDFYMHCCNSSTHLTAQNDPSHHVDEESLSELFGRPYRRLGTSGGVCGGSRGSARGRNDVPHGVLPMAPSSLWRHGILYASRLRDGLRRRSAKGEYRYDTLASVSRHAK
jgi:hypothetical protein